MFSITGIIKIFSSLSNEKYFCWSQQDLHIYFFFHNRNKWRPSILHTVSYNLVLERSTCGIYRAADEKRGGGIWRLETPVDKHVQIIFHLTLLILRMALINCKVKGVAFSFFLLHSTYARTCFEHVIYFSTLDLNMHTLSTDFAFSDFSVFILKMGIRVHTRRKLHFNFVKWQYCRNRVNLSGSFFFGWKIGRHENKTNNWLQYITFIHKFNSACIQF